MHCINTVAKGIKIFYLTIYYYLKPAMTTLFKTLSGFFFITVLLSTSCKKQKDPTKNAQLPPATQEGKNTIGFTIDGEVWVPYARCGFGQDPCGEISARYGASGGAAPDGIGFQFARFRNNKSSSLTIYNWQGNTITTIGEKIDSIGVEYSGENSTGNTDNYSHPLLGSSFFITKLDSEKQIISGVFKFILSEDNRSGKIIILKEGRFDFKFNACKCSN
jgi:hypothetical protein